jgi:hypothetical protein
MDERGVLSEYRGIHPPNSDLFTVMSSPPLMFLYQFMPILLF